MLSASYDAISPLAFPRQTVTNNHVCWKQAIGTGAVYLDLFSAVSDKKKCRNPTTLLPLQRQQQPRTVSVRCPRISVDFLSHSEKKLRFKNLST